MAKKKKTKKEVSLDMYLKANKRGSREAELEFATGFRTVHKAHKTAKDYKRKDKHKKVYTE